MKGCRPLTDTEITQVLESFTGDNSKRDKCLVLLGIKSGFRISELLSITVGDVFQAGKVTDRVRVERKHMKMKLEGRTVLLHPMAKAAIHERLKELEAKNQLKPETFLFRSQRNGNSPLSRMGAWSLLKRAYKSQGMTGKGLASHTLRKTFADRIYKKLNYDLVRTQRALNQRQISSTIAYLSFSQIEVDEAILSI